MGRQTLNFTVADARAFESKDYFFKHSNETRRNWGILAAPVVAYSEKSMRISYVDRESRREGNDDDEDDEAVDDKDDGADDVDDADYFDDGQRGEGEEGEEGGHTAIKFWQLQLKGGGKNKKSYHLQKRKKTQLSKGPWNPNRRGPQEILTAKS